MVISLGLYAAIIDLVMHCTSVIDCIFLKGDLLFVLLNETNIYIQCEISDFFVR